jgi:hypothetical protein
MFYVLFFELITPKFAVFRAPVAFLYLRRGFRLTVTSFVMTIIHTADSVAAGIAACRLMSSLILELSD